MGSCLIPEEGNIGTKGQFRNGEGEGIDGKRIGEGREAGEGWEEEEGRGEGRGGGARGGERGRGRGLVRN